MLKKSVAYAIIFSLLYSDALHCMDPDPHTAEKTRHVVIAQKPSEQTSLLKPQVNNPRYNSLSSTPSPRSDEISQGSPPEDEKQVLLNHLNDSIDLSSSDDTKDPPLAHSGDIANLPLAPTQEDVLENKDLPDSSSSIKESNANIVLPTAQNDALDDHATPPLALLSTGNPLLQNVQTPVQADTTSKPAASPSPDTASQPLLPKTVPAPSLLPQQNLKINAGSDDDSFVELGLTPIDPKYTEGIKALTSKDIILEDKLKLHRIKVHHIGDYTLFKQLKAIAGAMTKEQWVAIGGGLIVGVMTARAMLPVYNGGLLYLDEEYNISPISIENGGKWLGGYIVTSVLFDAIPRNIGLWKKATTSLAVDGLKKGRTALTAFVSFFPSLLEPAFLITAEMYILSKLGWHGIDNIYAQTMLLYSPFLLADSWAFNYDLTWEVCDELKEWFQTSEAASFWFGKTLTARSLSPEANIRHDFRKTLNKLSQHVYSLDPDDPYITNLETSIANFETNIKAQFPDLEEQNVNAAHTVFLVYDLLARGNNIRSAQKYIKSWYETITDGITYGTLALGSPMRFFALQCGIEGFFELLTSEATTQACGLIGSSLGFLLLTTFEYKGLKNFFRDFLWHENPNAHGSHPWFRIGQKGLSAITGLVFTAPLLVLSIQACDKWFSDQPLMKLLTIPYLFAEFTAQTTSFYDSYNKKVGSTGVGIYNNHLRKRIYNEGPRNDYKKDQVLQTIENMKNRMESFPPFMLHMLNNGLQAPEGELGDFLEPKVIQ